MKNDFINPFQISNPVTPPLAINREVELIKAVKLLYYEKSNLKISGTPSIGKTTFLNQLHSHIREQYKDVLILRLNIFSIIDGNNVDLSRLFLSAIIAEAWENIFKENYSILLNKLRKNDESVLDNDESKLFNIFRFVRQSNLSSKFEKTTTLGSEFILKTGVGLTTEMGANISELFAFEFEKIMEDLFSILNKNGLKNIIVLLDEANYFDEKDATNLIRKNFNLFTSNRIQFAFVTFPAAETQKTANSYEAGKIFNRIIELKAFQKREQLDELIDKYIKSVTKINKETILFTDEAKNMIWEITGGHPKQIQLLCYLSWEKANEDKVKSINKKTIDEIISEFNSLK